MSGGGSGKVALANPYSVLTEEDALVRKAERALQRERRHLQRQEDKARSAAATRAHLSRSKSLLAGTRWADVEDTDDETIHLDQEPVGVGIRGRETSKKAHITHRDAFYTDTSSSVYSDIEESADSAEHIDSIGGSDIEELSVSAPMQQQQHVDSKRKPRRREDGRLDGLSRRERKQLEMEELERALSEAGLTPASEEPKPQRQQQSIAAVAPSNGHVGSSVEKKKKKKTQQQHQPQQPECESEGNHAFQAADLAKAAPRLKAASVLRRPVISSKEQAKKLAAEEVKAKKEKAKKEKKPKLFFPKT